MRVAHLKLTFPLRFSQLSLRVGPSSPKRSQAKRGETRNPNSHIITIVIIMTITGIVSVMHELIEQHDEEMIVNSIISLLLD